MGGNHAYLAPRVRSDPGRGNRSRRLSCSAAAPCPEMAKSTLSHHFRVLRDAGLIRTTKEGVENLNGVRWDEVNARFPGLLKAIMKFQP